MFRIRREAAFDKEAAERGKQLFRNEAGCATCHQSPNFTDVLSGPDRTVPFLHDPAEVGMDPAMRPGLRQESTGRRRYADCGSTPRIFMMAVRPISSRW